MDEMKPKENAYSGERGRMAQVTSQAEVSAHASSAENAGTPHQVAQSSGIGAFLELASDNLPTSLAEVSAFLKHTKRVWLMAAGILIGAAALLNLTARAAEWAKNSRGRRQLHAMATLTPGHLFARSGAAVRDAITFVYSVFMRTL